MQHDGYIIPSKTGPFAHPRRNVACIGIEPGMHVADFGSGSGAYTIAIAERLEGSGRVYAIDIQRDLLRRLANEASRRGFRNVEVLWGDLEEHRGSKIADSALDVVLLSNLLFQVLDKRAVLAEAERILRPRGRIVIVDWLDSYNGMGPHPDHVIEKESALQHAFDHGFELIKEFAAGAHHYGLILRRSKPN